MIVKIVQTTIKSLKTSIGAITNNPEKPKFVSDYIKTKKMSKNVVKKLPFVTRYVPNQYNTEEMCDWVILEMVKR